MAEQVIHDEVELEFTELGKLITGATERTDEVLDLYGEERMGLVIALEQWIVGSIECKSSK